MGKYAYVSFVFTSISVCANGLISFTRIPISQNSSYGDETIAISPSRKTVCSIVAYSTSSKVIEKYIDRVNFTHFKDIKGIEAKSDGMASAGMEVYSNFCELGTGIVDFKSIFKMLKDFGYDGPLCEELDQAPISNEISAENNFKFLMENY